MIQTIGYRNWRYWLLLASLSCIAIATLNPFKVEIPPGFSSQYIVENFNFGSSLKDYWQNILLFIPWGIGLGAIAKQKKDSLGLCLLICFLVSGILSMMVELSQIFLPTRISNVTDIICNSLGGSVGGILFWWHDNILDFLVALFTRRKNFLNLKFLIKAIAIYCFIVSVSMVILASSVNLSNWNDHYHLAIGNETTGDRPWHGFINSVYISDQAFGQPEIIQAFEQTESFFAQQRSLTTAINFSDLQPEYVDQSKTIAELVWQNKSQLISTFSKAEAAQNGRIYQYLGISLGDRWLKSKTAATNLNKQLKKTGNFSLFLTVATQDLRQTGPGRIVALSNGIYAQNLIVAQENQDLVIRLRTPITGDNANQPTFVVPDIFDDYNFHQILLIFVNKELSVYVDNNKPTYEFKFNLYNSYLSYLPWNIHNWTVNLKDFRLLKYQIGFYLVVCAPLIGLIGLIVLDLQQQHD